MSQGVYKITEELFAIFNEHIIKPEINFNCPFGDGKSAEKIIKILKNIR